MARTMMEPSDDSSIVAVRGADRSWDSHRQCRGERTARQRSCRSFDGVDYDSQSCGQTSVSERSYDSHRSLPLPRSHSPSSVAQAFRTGQRVKRKVSKPEQAQVSRPGPLREDSSTRLKDYRGLKDYRAAATVYIEIEPGVKAPLRRSEDAIRKDAFVTTSCFGCEAQLFCIDDAKYMICPHCKSVSPMFMDEGHGVGLGFTHQTLLATTQKNRRRR